MQAVYHAVARRVYCAVDNGIEHIQKDDRQTTRPQHQHSRSERVLACTQRPCLTRQRTYTKLQRKSLP